MKTHIPQFTEVKQKHAIQAVIKGRPIKGIVSQYQIPNVVLFKLMYSYYRTHNENENIKIKHRPRPSYKHENELLKNQLAKLRHN